MKTLVEQKKKVVKLLSDKPQPLPRNIQPRLLPNIRMRPARQVSRLVQLSLKNATPTHLLLEQGHQFVIFHAPTGCNQ